MQVFLISESPLETANVLDPKRLNKQILECDWILDGFKDNKRSVKHPIAQMYKNHLEWLSHYKKCLMAVRDNDMVRAVTHNALAMELTPKFLNQPYFDNFKKRLYTKDKDYYRQYEPYGTTDENWYFVDGQWRVYVNGKFVRFLDNKQLTDSTL